MAKRLTQRGNGASGALPGDLVWPHVCRRYQSCVLEYRRSLAKCRRRLSRTAVHDLRVAIRRLLACVELLRAAGGRDPGVRRQLKEQLAVLGALRDTQVQLRIVRSDAERAREMEPLVEQLRRLRKRRARAAERELAQGGAARRLEGFAPGPAPGGERAVIRLREFIERRLRRAAGSLAALSSGARLGPLARHRARVRLRKLHLILEALRPVWHGDRDGRLSRSLSACQGVIGQVHDRELLLRRIGRLVSEGRLSGEAARALNEQMETEKAGRMKACRPLILRARARSRACA
jgi:CHAD domain-containing protein